MRTLLSVALVLASCTLSGCSRTGRVTAAGCSAPEGTIEFKQRSGKQLDPGMLDATVGRLAVVVQSGTRDHALLPAVVLLFADSTAVDTSQATRQAGLAERGPPDWHDVPAGRYRLDIRNPGYAPLTRQITLRAGSIDTVNARLRTNPSCSTP